MMAPSMNLARIAFLLSAFVAGCSAIAPSTTMAPLPEIVAPQPSAAPQPSTARPPPTVPQPAVVATRPPPATQPTAGTSAPTTPKSTSAVIAAPAVPATGAKKKQSAVRAEETPAAATRLPAAPVPTAATEAKPAPKSTAVVAAPAAPPSMDLNALKEQLKDTKAIGVFTKLSLKNQVDDLLQQFRDYYQGKATITMAQLRRSYDLLLMKVLSLIQDTDQKLASAIVASRESIWGLLSDQKKFSTLEG